MTVKLNDARDSGSHCLATDNSAAKEQESTQQVEYKRVDNLIPLLVHHKGLSVQQAVDETALIINRTYLRFLELELRILQIGATHDIGHQVQCFLESCRSCCIGIFHWYYSIGRYIPPNSASEETDVFVVLGQDLPVEV